jgi:hypothetical protein
MTIHEDSVFIELRVNGAIFDTPTSVVIKRNRGIPTCEVKFPTSRSQFRLTKKDYVTVKVGLNKLPVWPTFSGYMTDPIWSTTERWQLAGEMYHATKKFYYMSDLSNFDGMEISQAVITALYNVPFLSYGLAYYPERTSPAVFVDKFRAEKGISAWELACQFRDMAVDNQYAINVRDYHIFEHAGTIYFRKVPDPSLVAQAEVELDYGYTIIDIDGGKTGAIPINAQWVFGKEGVIGYYENANRIAVDEYIEGDPIEDNNIPNNATASEIARIATLSRMFQDRKITVKSNKLIDCIPYHSVVQLNSVPYGLSGKYLINNLTINASSSKLSVEADMRGRSQVFTEALSRILGLGTISSLQSFSSLSNQLA